jgi:aminodeoxyfutalosine synthase
VTTASSDFDTMLERVTAGERLSAPEIAALSDAPDILPLGMLADALRRRLRGTAVTYLRVASCAVDQSFTEAVPPAAREVRITGAPATLDVAVTAVRSAKAVAGDRTVSGFSWSDIDRVASASGTGLPRALEMLRAAGLEAIAELPMDVLPDGVIGILADAGFRRLRLTIERAPAADRRPLVERASALQDRYGCIQAVNPLPTLLQAFRPTTGYEDVKAVAMARLAAPNIPTIQVDWSRYGPKLAQVALTFGADDLDAVTASDEAPDGRRRAPVEEVRRNIAAAGLTPAERDGRFNQVESEK